MTDKSTVTDQEPKPTDTGGDTTQPDNGGQITLTQEELDKKLAAEADRRVTQALKTAQDKWEKEFSSKISEARIEAEKLARMKEDEKAQELIKIKERELEEREQKFLSEIRSREVKAYLKEAGIDERAEGLLDGDEWQKKAETLSDIIKVKVEAAIKPVQEKLDKLEAEAGRPGGGGGAQARELDKTDVSAVTRKYNEILTEKGKQAAQAFLDTIYKR